MSRTRNFSVTSPIPYHYTTALKGFCCCIFTNPSATHTGALNSSYRRSLLCGLRKSPGLTEDFRIRPASDRGHVANCAVYDAVNEMMDASHGRSTTGERSGENPPQISVFVSRFTSIKQPIYTVGNEPSVVNNSTASCLSPKSCMFRSDVDHDHVEFTLAVTTTHLEQLIQFRTQL